MFDDIIHMKRVLRWSYQKGFAESAKSTFDEAVDLIGDYIEKRDIIEEFRYRLKHGSVSPELKNDFDQLCFQLTDARNRIVACNEKEKVLQEKAHTIQESSNTISNILAEVTAILIEQANLVKGFITKIENEA